MVLAGSVRWCAMDRLACVEVQDLPLQLLKAHHPQWQGLPTVVLDQDRPQGKILWVSPEARQKGVTPGMRYAEALSFTPDLQGAEVPEGEIKRELEELADLLRGFSPEVEASEVMGVFWLSGRGLRGLFPSYSVWAREIHRAVSSRGRRCSVVVGFSRFRTYALAKVTRGIRILTSPEEERDEFLRVPLDVLWVDPPLVDLLLALGIRTIGEFIKLPLQGIQRRFGQEAVRLHQMASGALYDPLMPQIPEDPFEVVVSLDEPISHATTLLFLVKGHLHGLLRSVRLKGKALAELKIRWCMGQEGDREDSIRPASPTLDEALVLDLVRLRLEGAPLAHPVREIRLWAMGVNMEPAQGRLFLENPRRDLSAGNRALARLRAELGQSAVVKATLVDAHLPEARFLWEPLECLSWAKPAFSDGLHPLIRRMYTKPQPLGMRPRHEPDGWLVKDLACGPVIRLWGPYVISGGWWRREVHRSYYFLETLRGDILWVYYDAPRRRWFLQGQVE